MNILHNICFCPGRKVTRGCGNMRTEFNLFFKTTGLHLYWETQRWWQTVEDVGLVREMSSDNEWKEKVRSGEEIIIIDNGQWIKISQTTDMTGNWCSERADLGTAECWSEWWRSLTSGLKTQSVNTILPPPQKPRNTHDVRSSTWFPSSLGKKLLWDLL